MRRVAVTGLGIICPIGNSTQEVVASLREGRSGITKAETYQRMGFRSQVEGSLKIDLDSVVDRRARRFMGDGAAYNFLAMQQAITDSGLEEKDIINERTGLIMGSGGPSTKSLVAAADTARSEPVKGPKRVGPFVVPKAMSSTCSAVLATWYKIKGLS
jgi:3-oxoacyl-[acyl-carrier-protein] synthase-1